MINKIIEQKGKSYIVESVDGERLKVKEFLFDTLTGMFVKLKAATISGEYKIIGTEIVKLKYSQKVEIPKKRVKVDE